ncbi:MAG: hypothetical protein GXX96_17670 [Planctomycetaceae bacterium]|nr:hypothetical protein [Planctomycetaceae bacterium]
MTRKLVTPLNGVNAGPGHLPGGMPGDLTSQYQEMGSSGKPERIREWIRSRDGLHVYSARRKANSAHDV